MNASQSTGPDPDVAGPGVMIGFIVTGLLATIGSSLASYLRIIEDHQHTLWLRRPELRVSLKNSLRSICPESTEDPVEFWNPILQDFVLNLSDQQLITGLLLITLAYPKYFLNDVDSLSIAGDLAFFSMITHFATILTIQSMLRDHFTLAVLRMFLVFATMILWLIISIATLLFIQFRELGDPPPNIVFILISSILEILGVTWVFWDISLSLFVSDSTLKARRCISRSVVIEDTDQQAIVEWLNKHEEYHDIPRGFWSYIGFALRKPLSLFFATFCRRYIVPKSRLEHWFLWGLAELIFPFRFGNFMQVVLLFIGLMNLGLDLAQGGLASSWGFGQLLPTFMLFLPFFSLAESYAKSKLEQAEQREEHLHHAHDRVDAHSHADAQNVPTPQAPLHNEDVAEAIEMHEFAAPERIHPESPHESPQNSPPPGGTLHEPPSVTSSRETLIQHPRQRNAGRNSTWPTVGQSG